MEVAEVCLEGVDPVSGETALCAACTMAQKDSAQYLLSCGAALSRGEASRRPAKAKSRSAPRTAACAPDGQPNAERAISPLVCAVIGGSWEIVSALLARGLDADREAAADGFTPLMAAAKHGHIGVMELLLSRGRQENKIASFSHLYLSTVNTSLAMLFQLLPWTVKMMRLGQHCPGRVCLIRPPAPHFCWTEAPEWIWSIASAEIFYTWLRRTEQNIWWVPRRKQ